MFWLFIQEWSADDFVVPLNEESSLFYNDAAGVASVVVSSAVVLVEFCIHRHDGSTSHGGLWNTGDRRVWRGDSPRYLVPRS